MEKIPIYTQEAAFELKDGTLGRVTFLGTETVAEFRDRMSLTTHDLSDDDLKLVMTNVEDLVQRREWALYLETAHQNISDNARQRVRESLADVARKGPSAAGRSAMELGHGPYADIYRRKQASEQAMASLLDPSMGAGFIGGGAPLGDIHEVAAKVQAALDALEPPALIAREFGGNHPLELGLARDETEAAALAVIFERFCWLALTGNYQNANGLPPEVWNAEYERAAEIRDGELRRGVDRREEIVALYETGDASAWMLTIRELPENRWAAMLCPPTFRFCFTTLEVAR